MTSEASKWALILNPAAGGGRALTRSKEILEKIREIGLDFVEYRTQHAGHAKELARQARDEGFENFLVIGGDGTSFEVINGLFGDGKKPKVRLALLPAGTGNSFLRDFSLDGLNHTLKCLKNNQTRPCDIMQLTHEGGETFFMNLLSFGFVADVASTTNRRFKKFGEAGYVAGVLTNLIGLKSHPWKLSFDGQDVEEDYSFVSINNSRFTGGKMMMAPEASVSDGLADVILVSPVSRTRLIRTFPEIFSGKHIDRSFVRTRRAKKIGFHFKEKLDFMIDGEVTHFCPQSMEVLPRAMEVFA